MLRRTFAKNLRRLRSAQGLSQEALGDAAGLDRTYISALEREVYSASLDTIEKIAAVLEVSAVDLVAE